MEFCNRTKLYSGRSERMFLTAIRGWPTEGLTVSVRYSRGAEYSGTCFYKDGRVYINLGRDNRYPYKINTHIARARSNATGWCRELYAVRVNTGYELALFVFLHEFYHWLVRRARRNVRQKESRCDRFAVRWLVDRYGATVLDGRGRPAPRSSWDFQDVEGFVAAARVTRRRRVERTAAGCRAATSKGQMSLF